MKSFFNTTFKDRTGQRYGRLTAICICTTRQSPGGHTSIIWGCVCDCGNLTDVSSSGLSVTKSCGCLQKESYERMGLSRRKEGTAFRCLRDPYRKSATNRGINFYLSDYTFKAITSSNCFYCGDEPQLEEKRPSGEVYIHNGVDRLNPAGDYSDSNCVACCSVCNKMKGTLGATRFMTYVRKIFCNSNFKVVDRQ